MSAELKHSGTNTTGISQWIVKRVVYQREHKCLDGYVFDTCCAVSQCRIFFQSIDSVKTIFTAL